MMSNINNDVTILPFPPLMKAVLWQVTNFNRLLQGMHFASVNKVPPHLLGKHSVPPIAYYGIVLCFLPQFRNGSGNNL